MPYVISDAAAPGLAVASCASHVVVGLTGSASTTLSTLAPDDVAQHSIELLGQVTNSGFSPGISGRQSKRDGSYNLVPAG